MLRIVIIFNLFYWANSINAQIKLDYEPNGMIVKIDFDSLTIFTDTTSIFQLYNKSSSYHLTVRKFVREKFNETKSDTIIFQERLISFGEMANSNEKFWFVYWALIELTKENKLKIINKYGRKVNDVIRRRIGTRKKGRVRRAFIDKKSRMELFYYIIFNRTKCLNF